MARAYFGLWFLVGALVGSGLVVAHQRFDRIVKEIAIERAIDRAQARSLLIPC